ncbi:threonine/serine exporter family protein [Paucibacter sp. O1-1]|nr:threonine/serine exporter family protein [Paucibacter sp. O1-1]MDA3830798.1 threonine/serine exporter family protein [Paucibacter sp. O1-1]
MVGSAIVTDVVNEVILAHMELYGACLPGLWPFSRPCLVKYYLGESIGIFVGALTVGIYSNLYARWMKAPVSIALLQNIVILVPGSKTYIGLNALISGETMLNQAHLGSQIFLIFMSLIAGLIFANVVVPPRRSPLWSFHSPSKSAAIKRRFCSMVQVTLKPLNMTIRQYKCVIKAKR